MFAVKTDSEAGSQLPLMAETAKSSGQRGHHITSAVARIADMLAAKISGQKSCIMYDIGRLKFLPLPLFCFLASGPSFHHASDCLIKFTGWLGQSGVISKTNTDHKSS